MDTMKLRLACYNVFHIRANSNEYSCVMPHSFDVETNSYEFVNVCAIGQRGRDRENIDGNFVHKHYIYNN